MIFKSIYIKEGMNEKTFDFSAKTTLIFSEENSCGKSTLMRLLFYSIGYPIPSMENMDFSKLILETKLLINDMEYLFKRLNNSIEISSDNFKEIYCLPNDFSKILLLIYGSSNLNLTDNILGCIYLDQDKGWTLLNRGIVIGKIRFSIEELISGLSDINCEELLSKLKLMNKDITNYKKLLDLSTIKESYAEESNEEGNLSYFDTLSKDAFGLNLKIKNLKKEIKSIDNLINANETFADFVDKMKLYIVDDDKIIPVTRHNLMNYDDCCEIATTRKNILLLELQELSRNYLLKQNEMDSYLAQRNNLIDGLSNKDVLEKKLAKFDLPNEFLDTLYTQSIKERKYVKQQLRAKLRNQNDYITFIYNYAKDFSKILDLSEKALNKEDYIFTDDLKSKSGAILQKLVFTFKMAYIKALENKLGTTVPIVLDSPKGKELSDKNLNLMFKVLEEYFPNNQIIIASIYDMPHDKKHILKDKLLAN